jgi:ATP-dependent RNA helicase RhlE
MTPNTHTSADGFRGLAIAPNLLEILDSLKFVTPTPIQAQTIPVAIEGKDVVGIAQTGTGKTLAYGIPMLQRLSQLKAKGLVVLPTRELALQVEEVFKKIGKPLGLRTVVLIGGVPIRYQLRDLTQKPHIVIATPGRLNDHLMQGTIKLNNVGVLVLDEADQMLDMGFLPQIQKILQAMPQEHQTMLFSATMPQQIMKIATTYMNLPVRFEIAPAGTTAAKVTQELFVVPREQKINLLGKLLQEYRGSTLVFIKTKHNVKRIVDQIKKMGVTAAEIHSNRSLGQRREALEGFKTGKYRVLVATDIASRGIDVRGIELVVNFDLPSSSEDYVHRIGRTARGDAAGHAISFAMPDQAREVRDIEYLIRQELPITKLPELPKVQMPDPIARPSGPRIGPRGRSYSRSRPGPSRSRR